MADYTSFLVKQLLSNEKVSLLKKINKSMSCYSKTMEIIERTYIAMGKKSSYSYSASSTLNQKLNTNVFASTY